MIDADGTSGSIRAANNAGDEGELTFRCGGAARLNLSAQPWSNNPAAGRARILRGDGILMEFPNIECGTNGDDFQVETYNVPYRFALDALGTGSGRHTLQNVTLDYAGADVFADDIASLELDCASTPVSGTFTVLGQPGVSGSFTCQP